MISLHYVATWISLSDILFVFSRILAIVSKFPTYRAAKERFAWLNTKRPFGVDDWGRMG
jgi:hypothetical protein